MIQLQQGKAICLSMPEKKKKVVRSRSKSLRRTSSVHVMPSKEALSGTPLPSPTARARFAGITTARERLERNVAAERMERLAAYEQQLEQLKSASAALKGGKKPPILRILAEGDSWFDYPLGKDVIEVLAKAGTVRCIPSDAARPGVRW